MSRFGRILIRLRRPLEGTPKTVTISREVVGWYACFSCADVSSQPLPTTGQETGLDLGIEAFATLSDGTRIFNPGWYRKAERALTTAQRRVSRRKRGGNRRRKAIVLFAKAHQKGPASVVTFTIRQPWRSFRPTTRSTTKRCDPPDGEESPSGQAYARRGVGRLPHHPDAQGGMGRSQDRCR